MDSGIQKRTWRNSPWTAVIVIPLVCVSLLAMLAPWAVSRSYPQSVRRACISNLKQIEGAQRTMELDRRHPGWREGLYHFTDGDLFGPTKYIPKKPVCPAGGTYILGASSATDVSAYVKPRCSIPGHTI